MNEKPSLYNQKKKKTFILPHSSVIPNLVAIHNKPNIK
jgi:hypothetical protein